MANPYSKQAKSSVKDKKNSMTSPEKLPNATDFPKWAKYAEKGGKTGRAGYEKSGGEKSAGIIKMEYSPANGLGRKELARKTKP